MKKLLPYLTAPALGCIALLVPLLRDFHFESAMAAAVIGCFWAGIASAKNDFGSDLIITARITIYIYLGGLPLFLSALFTGCLSADGTALWLLTPIPSLLFGTATGRLVRKFHVTYPALITVAILLFFGAGIFIYEFFHFPQVYFFNHVWGMWPGPIYDESILLSGSYLYFRLITLCWVILLWVLPGWQKSLRNRLLFLFSLTFLLTAYFNLSETGILSPEQEIESRLGSLYPTQHFDLYYDSRYNTEEEIRHLALKHEWHFQEITDTLEISWPEGRRIKSFIYPHVWNKKKLTGAKYTSYVPIWVDQDQMHTAFPQTDGVLRHELVHVLSKQFGNSLFNGSWDIGLIEGLAEAIAGDASPESTLDQLVAAKEEYPAAGQIRSTLSLTGFYADAGPVSYTTMGSFCAYLLRNYPVSKFKVAYSSANLSKAYGTGLDSLVSGWHRHLNTIETDSVAAETSRIIYSGLSVFEKSCPHSMSREAELWDQYAYYLAEEDTASATEAMDALLQHRPEADGVISEWMRNRLLTGSPEAVAGFKPDTLSAETGLLKADALMLLNQSAEARDLLNSVAPLIRTADEPRYRESLALRSDSLQWMAHLKRRYLNQFPGPEAFVQLNLPNRLLTVYKAANEYKTDLVSEYESSVTSTPLHPEWFEVTYSITEYLILSKAKDAASRWLMLMEHPELSLRQSERLSGLRALDQFIQSGKGELTPSLK